jgi:hypothetical protein
LLWKSAETFALACVKTQENAPFGLMPPATMKGNRQKLAAYFKCEKQEIASFSAQNCVWFDFKRFRHANVELGLYA